MEFRILIALVPMSLFLAGCENPGGITDDDYAKYKQLAAPKILYSCARLGTRLSMNFAKCIENPSASYCTGKEASELVERDSTVQFSAGVGKFVTYNSLLQEVQASCSGEFKRLKILESEK